MIELHDIVVKFGEFTALNNINVHVKEGEFFTFLGPSGCGKTTTLRTITGFIRPESGIVSMRGRDITRVPIEERSIGGLGIFLVKRNVDGISYRRRDGYNILTIEKNLG